jgi:hypothetical protein
MSIRNYGSQCEDLASARADVAFLMSRAQVFKEHPASVEEAGNTCCTYHPDRVSEKHHLSLSADLGGEKKLALQCSERSGEKQIPRYVARPHKSRERQERATPLGMTISAMPRVVPEIAYFFSVISTAARVVSQSRCIVQTLPPSSNPIVKSSSGDGSFDSFIGTRAKSESSPG